MPTTKLTIVPVKLDPINHEESLFVDSPKVPSEPSCIIQIADAQISFFNGVDERIIQTIMRELNKR